jgi:hypothetical protein
VPTHISCEKTSFVAMSSVLARRVKSRHFDAHA